MTQHPLNAKKLFRWNKRENLQFVLIYCYWFILEEEDIFTRC